MYGPYFIVFSQMLQLKCLTKHGMSKEPSKNALHSCGVMAVQRAKYRWSHPSQVQQPCTCVRYSKRAVLKNKAAVCESLSHCIHGSITVELLRLRYLWLSEIIDVGVPSWVYTSPSGMRQIKLKTAQWRHESVLFISGVGHSCPCDALWL